MAIQDLYATEEAERARRLVEADESNLEPAEKMHTLERYASEHFRYYKYAVKKYCQICPLMPIAYKNLCSITRTCSLLIQKKFVTLPEEN